MFPTFHFNIERWKYNPTFELYVSTKGRIRNKSKADIAPKVTHGGYLSVYVYGSLNKYMLLHRVVMLTWRPTPEAEELTVDHKNHNKRDNSLDNLEWVSFEENQRRASADLVNIDDNGTIIPKKQKTVIGGVAVYGRSLNGVVLRSSCEVEQVFAPFIGKLNGFSKNGVTKYIQEILNGTNTAGVKKYCGFQLQVVRTPVIEKSNI